MLKKSIINGWRTQADLTKLYNRKNTFYSRKNTFTIVKILFTVVKILLQNFLQP